MTRPETLQLLRPAHVRTDGAAGHLFRHHGSTGWQELVFPTKEAAAAFIAARNFRAA
jgi:hypothetical protein